MKLFCFLIFQLFFLPAAISQTFYDTLFVPEPPGLTSTQKNSQSDLEVDINGNIWITFNSEPGVYYYNNITQNYNLYNSQTVPGILSQDSVRDIFIDSLQTVHLSGSSGLTSFDGINWSILSSLSGNTAGWSNEKLLYATNGSGLAIWDGSQWSYSNSTNSALNNDSILLLHTAVSGNLYAVTPTAIFVAHSWQGNFPIWQQVFSPVALQVSKIAESSDGKIWVIGNTGTYCGINDILYNYRDIHEAYMSPGANCNALSNNKTATTMMEVNNGILYTITQPYSLGKKPKTHITSYKLFMNTGGLLDTCYNVELPFFNGISGHLSIFNDVVFFKRKIQGAWGMIFRIYLNNLPPPAMVINNDYGEFLTVNEVSTLINNVPGSLFWDVTEQTPYYTVPKCSTQNALWGAGLWIGGMDTGNNIHLSACTYSQMGAYSFFRGPLDTITCSMDTIGNPVFGNYSGSYSIYRSQVAEFILQFAAGNVQNGTYKIHPNILNWPAHGTGNFTRFLAEFTDVNADGIYNPYDGDYPAIKGDQTIFAVFNDNHIYNYNGKPLGVEVHLYAYAYSCPQLTGTVDSIINYSTFYRYKIINRSDTVYNNLIMSFWTDPDLGNASDDYIGCDVIRNTVFTYNGDNNDEGTGGYGIDPPAIGCVLLNSPLALPNDGIDNDHDSLYDEPGESLGLSSFMYNYGGSGSPQGWPVSRADYYNYMSGKWMDGQHLTYGGNGSISTNPPADFMFPDLTDPAFPFNSWTMPGAGIQPDDMRYTPSYGPATLYPDSTLTYEFAIVYGRTQPGGGNMGSVQAMLNGVDIIKSMYDNNSFPSCSQVGIAENKPANHQLSIAPNPASSIVEILTVPKSKDAVITLYDINGKQILNTSFKRQLNISSLQSGVYLLHLKDGDHVYRTKLIKTFVD